MNNKIQRSKRIKKILIISSLLSVGASKFLLDQTHAEVVWEYVDDPRGKHSSVIWETLSDPERRGTSRAPWQVISKPKGQDRQSTRLIWEKTKTNDTMKNPTSKNKFNSSFTPPSNLEEAEFLLKTIPLQSDDFQPLLNHSHAVPTASVLNQEEWNLISSTISPFKYASGTGNQNYSIRIDYGLSDTLQISGFYSEADDPLNASITGLDIRPGNFWEVYGAAARWKLLANKSWSLALNSSLENWTVGSGGSDSRSQNSNEAASPNIFNNSGSRVETKNLVGSISIPLTWYINKKWQFTFCPGISFLPSSQGKGQGGEGEFYGTNPYLSGGLLWHPIPELGLTASIAKPVGSGTNSFDRNLKYSRVPIFSGGLNWHLNPRIALQGQLTNSFGATPATALLTLPSDNRLGYSANIVLTLDAADTPQPPLSSRQKSLSIGGLTVNTALVSPDKASSIKISSDTSGNFESIIGHSISNIFQLDFYRSTSNNVQQSTEQASTFLNNDGVNWRGSGKAVLTSPLRGAPIWSALRISFGRNMDISNDTGQGYLFAESPLTWEANSKIAVNISPKVAWTGVGSLWGLGVSTNIQLAPRWEAIPEVNIVLNSQKQSNGTLAFRWNASENIAIETYGSTASSIVDIGHLINSEKIRWGSRLILRF